MWIDLSDDETTALLRELDRIVESDRYPFSPRIRTLPAIRATAGRLPLRDASVDAAMAVLTVHHWDAEQEAGVRELRRVARSPVVIVTYDPNVSGQMWLMRDYFPEMAELDNQIFPTPEQLTGWLGGGVQVHAIPCPADTSDWTLGSFWRIPSECSTPTPEARHRASRECRCP